MTDFSPTPSSFDPSARWVRIVDDRADGMVEFEFAVGEPGLYVEMVMPRAQFEDFCTQQRVVPSHHTGSQAGPDSDDHPWEWNLHAARTRRLRGGND